MFIIKINCVMIWTKFSDKSGWYDSGPKGETIIGIFPDMQECEEFLEENGFKYKRKQIGKDETIGSTIWHAEVLKLHRLTKLPENILPVFPKIKLFK